MNICPSFFSAFLLTENGPAHATAIPPSFASLKSGLVFTFLVLAYQVVLKQRPLNGCLFFSLGLVVMKLNIRQQKQTTKEQSGLSLKTKTNEKLNVNLNQQSTVRTAHVCVHTTAQWQYTIQHRTVLIIFSIIFQASQNSSYVVYWSGGTGVRNVKMRQFGDNSYPETVDVY